MGKPKGKIKFLGGKTERFWGMGVEKPDERGESSGKKIIKGNKRTQTQETSGILGHGEDNKGEGELETRKKK